MKKILSLEVENVKRIRAVQIHPTENTVLIKGRNGAGKTSVLDSIMMALEGRITADPIRHGEEKATIRVDLGDMLVEKKITRKGAYLKVTAKDGAQYPSPQRMLDEFLGNLSFDPLEFARMRPRDQRDLMLRLAGVDLDEIEERRKETFEMRTQLNRDVKRLQGSVDQYGDLRDIPSEPVSVVDLSKELDQERGKIQKKEQLAQFIETCEDRIRRIAFERAELQQRLEALDKEDMDLRVDVVAVQEKREAVQVNPDRITELEYRILEADKINARVHDRKQRDAALDELKEAKAESERLTAELEQIDQEKLEALENAALPITGLGVDGEHITLDGTVFSELSSAEQLRVSLAIAMAQNPDLRVILIRDGSLLDQDSLALIREAADSRDYQVWIERVGTDGEMGFIIEDGSVQEHAVDNNQRALFGGVQ